MSGVTRRIVSRDRQWLDSPTVGICGPFDAQALDGVADAVAAVAGRHPHSRFGWRLGATGRRWIVGDRPPPVVVRPGDDDVGATLTSLANATDLSAPLVFVRSGNYLALRISHAVGDGTYFNRALSSVLATAQTGVVPDWPTNSRAGTAPLTSAVLRTFARKPATLRKAFADKAASASGGESGAAPAVGDTAAARRRTHVVTLPAGTAADVADRGRKCHAGASKLGLQIALVVRSLAAAGIVVDPNLLVLHDLRRYFGSPDLDGNFVVGVPARFDSESGPVGITASIRASSASGRPLLTQLAASLPRPRVEIAATGGAASLAVSSLGSPPALAGVRYLDGAVPVYTGSLCPAGSSGISVLFAEVHGALSISISHNEPTVDSRAVARAVEIIADDPVGVVVAR